MVAFSLHFQTQHQKVCDTLFESICEERDSQKSGYYDLPFTEVAVDESSCFVNDNKAFLQTLTW